MSLGDLISRFGDGTTVLETLSALDNPALLSAAREAATADGVSLDTWAREAVGRFTTFANDEQWLGLLGACRSTADPGSAALQYMIDAVLASASRTPSSGA